MTRLIALSTAALLLGLGAATDALADCTCRAHGRDIPLGQSTCLATPQGPRLAMCAMFLNNTTWRLSHTPCVVAESARPPASAGPTPNTPWRRDRRGSSVTVRL